MTDNADTGSMFSPDAIRKATFPKAGDWLQEQAVREYLRSLADHLERTPSAGSSRSEITAQTVEIISTAQLLAEQTIADAEQYSRDLIVTAREQYQELLRRAETATRTVDDAADPAEAAALAAGYTQPVSEIEYVRTYARVAHTQLRAVLDALAEQVERLGQLPDLPREPARAEPSRPPALEQPQQHEQHEHQNHGHSRVTTKAAAG